MELRQLVAATRTVRRFREHEPVSMDTLEQLVNLARLAASAGNLQPLRWVLVNDPACRAKVFTNLGWAAYLPDFSGPEPGQRPAAYLLVCAPEGEATAQVDAGIAMQTVMLGARERGLAACVLGSVNRDRLAELCDLPDDFAVLYVVALGRPAEEVVLEELAPDGNIKYWRDADGKHHVPKRGLEQIILARFGNHKE